MKVREVSRARFRGSPPCTSRLPAVPPLRVLVLFFPAHTRLPFRPIALAAHAPRPAPPQTTSVSALVGTFALASAAEFDLVKTFTTKTWCGPNDGMLKTQADCEAAAAKFGLPFQSVAGSEWHAGCLNHHGKVYYSALTAGGSHNQAVNDGYLCQNNKDATHMQTVWCGPTDGMINSEAECQAAAQANGQSYQSIAGSEWHAGCIIHNDGAYFVSLMDGAHNQAANGGYLCKDKVVTTTTTTTVAATTTTTAAPPAPVKKQPTQPEKPTEPVPVSNCPVTCKAFDQAGQKIVAAGVQVHHIKTRHVRSNAAGAHGPPMVDAKCVDTVGGCQTAPVVKHTCKHDEDTGVCSCTCTSA